MNNPFQIQPKKRPTFTNDSILEALRSLGSGVGKSVTKDVAGKVTHDAIQSIFGAIPKSGELKQNEPLTIKKEMQSKPQPEYKPMAPPVRMEEANLKQQIEAVRTELKMLAASVKNYNLEVAKAINEIPVDPGVYHLNFLERLRSVLKILRQQIEDSRSWLALWTGRKNKKQFWGMYKKHGTKFGLSSERTASTQSG